MEVWGRLVDLLEAKEEDRHKFVVRLLQAVARDPDDLRCMEAFGDLSAECRGALGDLVQGVSDHDIRTAACLVRLLKALDSGAGSMLVCRRRVPSRF